MFKPKNKNDLIFQIIDQIKMSRVPLWIVSTWRVT